MVGCVLEFCFIYMTNIERKVRSDQEAGGGTRAGDAAHNVDDSTTPKKRLALRRQAQARRTVIGMRQKATRLRRSTLNSLGRQTSSASVASASVAAIGHEGGVRILCFDGGGNRIAVALWILEHVEFIMGGPEWLSAYDVIGGISAGGLVAVMASDTKLLEPAISAHLGRPVWNRAADVREVLTQLMTLCFRTIRVWRLICCRGHLVDTKKCDALLVGLMSATKSFTCQPGQPHTMVLATRLDETNHLVEHVIANYPSPMAPRSPQLSMFMDEVLVGHPYERSTGWTRKEAAEATISVPVMCRPVIHQMRLPPESPIGPHRFYDGGLIRNMPAAHCVAEATKLWPGVPISCVHSFGTGTGGHQKGAKTSALGWLIALATPRNDEDSRFAQLKALMPRLEELRQESQKLMTGVLNDPPARPPSMVRINVVDGDLAEAFKLTVNKPEHMEEMKQATLRYVADNSKVINRIVEDMLGAPR